MASPYLWSFAAAYPRCWQTAESSSAYLWSMAVAFLSKSTALSQSWLLAASAPSRASLFASGFFLACAWHTCEAQRARAAIKIKVKDLFIDFCWTLVLFRQFEPRGVNSWL